MKKPSRKKPTQAAPMPIAKVELGEEIPAFLKKFVGKSPGQAAMEILMPNGGSEEATKLVAGIVSGIGDPGVFIPEWAKRASEKCIEAIGLGALKSLSTDTEDSQFSKGLGMATGLAEEMLKNPASSLSKMHAFQNEFVTPFVEFSKSVAVKAKSAEAAAFFNARHESEKLVEKAQNLQQRIKIYAVIAAGWQQIEKFKSTGDLYEWLMSHKSPDGRPFLAPQTDSREIRKICKEIGLKFQNKWQKATPKSPAIAPDSTDRITPS